MPFKRRFKDKYADSSPENASVVRTLFDLFSCYFLFTAEGFFLFDKICFGKYLEISEIKR